MERYSDIPFPAYRYIPFQGMPHPRNDPQGHSFGQEETYLPGFDPRDWMSCAPYLYGIDLFNHGYWWEAHEAWESVWLAAGPKTGTGIFVQGLIQIAAAQLKRYSGERRGAALLTHEGTVKIQTAGQRFLGIDTVRLAADALEALDSAPTGFPVILLTREPGR